MNNTQEKLDYKSFSKRDIDNKGIFCYNIYNITYIGDKKICQHRKNKHKETKN